MVETTIFKCQRCDAARARGLVCADCGGTGELRREIARWDDGLRDAAQMKRWRKECNRLDGRIAVMTARREALRRLMEGLPPEDAAPDPLNKPRRQRRGNLLTMTLRQIILASDVPLPPNDVLAALVATRSEFGAHLQKTKQGFYTGMSKLADRGEIIRYRGHLLSPAVFARFKADLAAGRVKDLEVPNGRWPDRDRL